MAIKKEMTNTTDDVCIVPAMIGERAHLELCLAKGIS